MLWYVLVDHALSCYITLCHAMMFQSAKLAVPIVTEMVQENVMPQLIAQMVMYLKLAEIPVHVSTNFYS